MTDYTKQREARVKGNRQGRHGRAAGGGLHSDDPAERLTISQAGVAARAKDTSVMRREGNTANVTHNGFSKKSPGVRAGLTRSDRTKARRRIAYTEQRLYEVFPHLDRKRDRFIVHELAVKVRQLHELNLWLENNGIIDAQGQIQKALEASDRLTKTVVSLLDRLGLTPQSALHMGLDLARGKALNAAEAVAVAKLHATERRPAMKGSGAE